MIESIKEEERLVKVLPSKRQMKHQEMEFYGFFHFSINTFTGMEWGDGTESPELFNPVEFDAHNWVRGIKAAGMTGAILTCKHHDGFCLWPSEYTDHSVKNSPFRDGKGDVVREVSDALKAEGLKFGVYLSPWDRNSELYGEGKPYDDFYINQLTELLTNYGEVFCVWLDGACGEGSNGKKQAYDWERYYAKIRELQPEACICVCGPDVRWCGNEAGDVRDSEWSVVPAALADAEKVADKSQKSDDSEFRTKKISSSEMDLGSRNKVINEKDLIWYPAEVNTSIRPGWFYHPEEDGQVKSLNDLVSLYEKSVGGNATFLLNIPPTPKGLLAEQDTKRLNELGTYIRNRYRKDLAKSASFAYSGDLIMSDDCLVRTKDGSRKLEIAVTFPEKIRAGRIIIEEKIAYGQRIEAFSVEAIISGVPRTVYEGTTVGYRKIVILDGPVTDEIRIKIKESRVSVCLNRISIYS
ncbi:alpha-L-fucosidase [Lachnospiraceae bacterium G11]|nr:alpha-L-fucosidase [Lachnospiraceae bacterium G11]